jgi:hypothetical protein
MQYLNMYLIQSRYYNMNNNIPYYPMKNNITLCLRKIIKQKIIPLDYKIVFILLWC